MYISNIVLHVYIYQISVLRLGTVLKVLTIRLAGAGIFGLPLTKS